MKLKHQVSRNRSGRRAGWDGAKHIIIIQCPYCPVRLFFILFWDLSQSLALELNSRISPIVKYLSLYHHVVQRTSSCPSTLVQP